MARRFRCTGGGGGDLGFRGDGLYVDNGGVVVQLVTNLGVLAW